jgi:hypothetical protein
MGHFGLKNHVDGTYGSRRARSWMLQYSIWTDTADYDVFFGGFACI